VSSRAALAKAPPDRAGARLPDGLVYVSDALPGIHRVRRGRGFAYLDAKGRALRDAQAIARIRYLAIPPAYRSVWICPLPNGHLQATGRDARGRKQYRYHAQWRELREQQKYERLAAFGRALPRIRARVTRDLRREGMPRERVLAAIVRLLDTTFLRVGNDEYARGNGSYGLTTLRNRHAGVKGATLWLRFRGKHGLPQEAHVDDPAVARVVRRCQQLPGQDLFEYLEADGGVSRIGSGDVNDYLAELAGQRFTAKDFRTWHGTVQALDLLRAGCHAGPREVLAEVAKRLGNTLAVCRKAYVHPTVLELITRGDAVALDDGPRLHGLAPAERRLLGLLERPAEPLAAQLKRSLRAVRRAA
jgi:DNA topoisomerase-1